MVDKVVFLDFDGVLFDTVKEAYCIAMAASGRADTVGNIDFASKHYAKFRKYRYLITRASDYYYLLNAIDGKTDIEAGYNTSVGSDTKGESEFSQKYFAERSSFKIHNHEHWLSLNTPYPFLKDVRKIIERRPEAFFIITTKDKDTVAALLRIHKIGFSEDNIFDLSSPGRFASKGEAMKFICDKCSVKESIYIDDSEYHLSQASDIAGMDTIHAGWGYVSGREGSASEATALAKIEKFLGD